MPATIPTVEVTCPTSLWTAVCEGVDKDEVVAAMRRRLPPDGLTAAHLRSKFHLREATLRLLDSRILKAALESFDQDIAGPLVSGLGAYQRVTEAARETLGQAEQTEVTVVLLDPHPVTWTDRFEVDLSVDRNPVAKFPFRLVVGVNLGETSVVVRKGAIEALNCELASLAVSFTFADLTPPLWAPEPRPLSVRLDPHPPLVVPLLPDKEVTQVPGPRESTRPQVPGASERSRG